MQVEIRPLPIKKWHGKKDGESFAQPKSIEALYDDSIGGLATGLTKEEEVEYGKKLGFNIDNSYNPESAHPFWGSKAAWVYLVNRTLVLDDKKAIDYVKIKMLKASKRVANSMAEWEANIWPDATHVIFDEQEEVALKASKVEQKNKAISLLGKMTAQDKINVVMILSEKSVKNQSADFITVEMDDIINDSNKVKQFLELMELGRGDVTIKANIEEMISKNIITKEGGSFYYMGEVLAMDKGGLIDYFKDPNNQLMKTAMINRLENK